MKRPRPFELEDEDNETAQKAWETLTTLLLRKGFGHLWMRHFIGTEFDRLIADPVLRKRMGVEAAK